MIDSQPDLAPLIRRVRGGYLKIQGTWMPYEVSPQHLCTFGTALRGFSGGSPTLATVSRTEALCLIDHLTALRLQSSMGNPRGPYTPLWVCDFTTSSILHFH
jgi:hypothetical protein